MERDSIAKTGSSIDIDRTQSSMDGASIKNLVRNSIKKVAVSSIDRTGLVDR
jgi:hypothetical protein